MNDIDNTKKQRQIYCLLIGIDRYLNYESPHTVSYPNLSGCVNDVEAIQEYLRLRLNIPSNNIYKLTSPNLRIDEEEQKSQCQLPTYETIVSTFLTIIDLAQHGDQVYFHYSGHGCRVQTIYPGLKANKLDEALVPMDIGDETTPYLRDVEISFLLQKMIDKGLFVTVVLDSCHSGGSTRGNVTVRGVSAIDARDHLDRSKVASHAELTENWLQVNQSYRSLASSTSAALADPHNYVLLAACRAHELAVEYSFDGAEKSGILTHTLIEAMKQLGVGFTYRHLYNRIRSIAYPKFRSQTPQLIGNGDRVIFGDITLSNPNLVNVLRYDTELASVLVDAGQAQGVRSGSEFGIFKQDAEISNLNTDEITLAKVYDRGATSSWAKILNDHDPIEPGSQAILLNPSSFRLKRRVSLFIPPDLSPTIPQESALARLEDAIRSNNTHFLELVDQGKDADFQIEVSTTRHYIIMDSLGQRVPNIPSLSIDAPDTPNRIVMYLVHLVKFTNVCSLNNPDGLLSPLSKALKLTIVPIEDTTRNLTNYLTGANDNYDLIHVLDGQKLLIKIRNEYHLPLNFTVLVLQVDWSIEQLYPKDSSRYFTLDPGEEFTKTPAVRLGENDTDGVDIIKVFATLGDTNFQWLELPAPGKGVHHTNRGRPQNRIEMLLASLVSNQDNVSTRALKDTASAEWTSEQILLRVTR